MIKGAGIAALALAALAATLPATSRAATIYVDDLADGVPGAGTRANPWRDLQDAIDAGPGRHRG